MVIEIKNLYEHRDPFTNNAFLMLGHEDGIITFGRDIIDIEKKLYQLIETFLQQ